MVVFVPRTRTIGVRLSEEEFAALERFCVDSGARSISDFARNAICEFLHHSNQQSVLALVSENSAQLKNLESKLLQISAEIDLLKRADTGQAKKRC